MTNQDDRIHYRESQLIISRGKHIPERENYECCFKQSYSFVVKALDLIFLHI